MKTVESEGSGHLIVKESGKIVSEIQSGPQADGFLESHDLSWDDVDSGKPVAID